MNKTEVVMLFKKIKVRYTSFTIPTEKESAREMVEEWLLDLEHVPLDTALGNLRTYAADPNNKFPPHPGVLAQSRHNPNDFYFELMKELGADTVLTIEQMKSQAVEISEEQRRKVRELLGK